MSDINNTENLNVDTDSALPQNDDAPSESGAGTQPAAATNEIDQEITLTPAPTPAPPCMGALDLIIMDPHGDPISGLRIKMLIKKVEVFVGKTDAKGRIKTIENLKLGSVFEIHVQNDIGNYKLAAIGKIESEENYACLTSPKTRFEFTTYAHNGESGTAAEHKKKVIKGHNQQPADTPSITGNPDTKPTVQQSWNDNGHPVAAVIDGAANWYGIHNDKAGHPEQDALTKLNTLVAFMEHQATLDYRVLAPITSDEIIVKMRKKTFVEPVGKKSQQFTKWCAKYVKVGLWYAGYGPATQSIGSGVQLARQMGPELIKAGFKEVALAKVKIHAGQQIIEQPDITFALPGDVIVYQKTAAPNEAGHIDVRTYHGFISDFVWPARNGFPDVRKYTVIGVYRKYSDTLAEARVKAFLRIIREHEAKGFKDPYYALRFDPSNRANPFVTFDDMTKHPFALSGVDTPAGAYQIKWKTFKFGIDATGWPTSFMPIDQDRMAIYLLQGRRAGKSTVFPIRTSLGFIMEGKVEQAINDTHLYNEWACLPGGGKQSQISMNEVKLKFEDYTMEYAQ